MGSVPPPKIIPIRPSPKLVPILRTTLSLAEYYGGPWERQPTLRSLRHALLRAIAELEADSPHAAASRGHLAIPGPP